MLTRISDQPPSTFSTSNTPALAACIASAVLMWCAGADVARAQTLLDANVFTSAPACVPGRINVPIVEWDLQGMGDLEPGAITIDVSTSSSDPSRVWFVTRQLNQHLYRLTPGRGRGSIAQWRSWSLDPLGGQFTGGLKKIRPAKDKRHVFVRFSMALEQVDTQCTASGTPPTCAQGLTVFRDRVDPITAVSDVAVDDFNNVYTTAPDILFDADGLMLPPSEVIPGYVQKLNPKAVSAGFTTVTRWHVGGGVGVCDESISELGPCLSGVDIDEKDQHLVYFSAQGRNSIGELNTKSTDLARNVRYWSLTTLSSQLGFTKMGDPIADPRQLKVVREDGKTVVWVVTGSGHVVRLIPQSGTYSMMSAHRMPDAIEDPFGVAPDGDTIGYTSVNSESGAIADPVRKDKVGMLLPKGRLVQVPADVKGAPISNPKIPAVPMPTMTNMGSVAPDKKVVEGRIERNDKGDTFVDAFVNRPIQSAGKPPSFRPMGITPDYASKVGTFFYAVGFAEPLVINRVGQAFLPPAERPKKARDDDDFDGDGKKNRYEDDDDDDDGTPNHMDRDNDNDCRDDVIDDDDDDNDGNDDKWDDPRKKESRDSRDHTTNGGASTSHQIVVPAGSTLLVAQAIASSLSTPLRVEILGPTGVKLASPLPTPGAAVATAIPLTAGTYTVRVTNMGLTAASLTTDLIVQELWPAVSPIVP